MVKIDDYPYKSEIDFAEKVSTLYSNQKKLLMHCLDLCAINKFDSLNVELDRDLLNKCLELKKVDIRKPSVLETLNQDERRKLLERLQYMLDLLGVKKKPPRLAKPSFHFEEDIIKNTIKVLDYMRKVL